jgi:hypothetical protein
MLPLNRVAYFMPECQSKYSKMEYFFILLAWFSPEQVAYFGPESLAYFTPE